MLETDGASLLPTACGLGLEGIIAKRLDSQYESGRDGEWRKIKCVQSDTFVIVGYEPSTTSPGAIASLLLAARYDDDLVFVGAVGTGFKNREARDLKIRLDGMKVKKPVVGV